MTSMTSMLKKGCLSVSVPQVSIDLGITSLSYGTAERSAGYIFITFKQRDTGTHHLLEDYVIGSIAKRWNGSVLHSAERPKRMRWQCKDMLIQMTSSTCKFHDHTTP